MHVPYPAAARSGGDLAALSVAAPASAWPTRGAIPGAQPGLQRRRRRRQPRSEPGQRLGPGRRPDLAVVGVRQRHRSLDALQRGRNAAAARRQRPRRADRHRVQRHAGRFPVAEPRTRRSSSPPRAARSSAGTADPRPPWRPTDRRPARSSRASRSPQTPTGPRIYATDFHNGAVDVFDSAWQPVPHAGFVDPFLPRHFAPFGIQTIGDRIFVTYAKQQAGSDDEAHGRASGIVDEFDTAGPPARARRAVRRAQRPLGHRLGAGGLRPLLRRPADRQLRRRPHHRLPRVFHGFFVPAGQLRAPARATRWPSTACGRSSSARARRTTAPPTRCSSPPDPTTSRTACSAPSARSRPRRSARKQRRVAARQIGSGSISIAPHGHSSIHRPQPLQ